MQLKRYWRSSKFLLREHAFTWNWDGSLFLWAIQGFIKAFYLLSVLWKKIEFYKRKSGDHNRNWGLGQSPGVVSGGKAQSFLMIYSHWTAYSGIKNLYSWPKKLYQFITNLFSLANIPTLGQVKYHIGKNLTLSCLRSWLTGVTERYLPLQCCTPTEVHVNKAQKNKSVGTSIILLQYVFSVSE